MPDPPLHPNCRCQVLDITRTRVEADSQEAGQDYIEGGSVIGGGHWMNNGRSPFDGPVYEKWCGQYWSGGRDTRDPKARGPKNSFPSDDMDAACQGHDTCYDMFEEDYCDRKLVKDLEALSDDPAMWRYPPNKQSREKARDFRGLAIWWFKRQIRMRENNKKRREIAVPRNFRSKL